MAMETEEELQAKTQKLNPAVWKKLLPFVRPYYKLLALLIGFNLLLALSDMSFPLFQRYAVDNFVVPQSTAGIGTFIGVYAAVVVGQTVLVICFIRMCMEMENKIARDMRQTAFVHLQKVALSYYNQNAVGYILARVMSDTARIAELVSWSMIDLVWAMTYVFGVFGVMLALNWKLALLVMLTVPAVAILTMIFEGKILRVNRKVRSINSKITGAYNEGITGAKTSKTLVIEDKNCDEFSKVTKDMYKNSIIATRINALFVPVVLFFGSMAAALVLARGGYMVMGDLIKFGTLSAFISYALGILEPVQQIASVFSEVIATQVNIERVVNLIEQPCEIQDTKEVEAKYGDCFSPKTENWEKIHGEIEFRDVWFKYPDGDEYILENFNLKIPAGTNVAIVGATGAGKSTLVNLACRFFEPTKGQILIDGVDYRERSQLWLHSHLGYVLQNPHLFSGTVRENIRYGKLDATDEEIEWAAKLVSADTVVAKLENGYDTDVGEGGDRLSTGEKQLISFARAVVANPPIFVLDEATSSIDTETEQLIQNAIAHILGGRTSFLIAHRLSTIRHADLILVVRDGKIIERGTHDELLEQKGYYYSLYTAMQVK